MVIQIKIQIEIHIQLQIETQIEIRTPIQMQIPKQQLGSKKYAAKVAVESRMLKSVV